MMETAIHEAGHAWAYVRQRRSIRYLTLRPRPPALGRTVVQRKVVDMYALSFSAAAGPVAEALWCQRAADDDPWQDLGWEDYLAGAFLAGGHDDQQAILPELLDSASWIEILRDELDADWRRVVDLGELLTERGRLDGGEAARILTPA
ncbi:hypothetical protein [Georgenia yuyongxinii]